MLKIRNLTTGRLALVAALAGLLAGAAHAQIGRSDAPVEITSDDFVYLQNEGRGVYTGTVVVTQGDSRINADKLTATCLRGPGAEVRETCEIEKMVAESNVYYTAPDVKIRGDKAEYNFTTKTITITGDVILSRGADGVVRGTSVVYNVDEGRTTITAGTGRVMSIFTPAKKKPADPLSAPTPN
jgi:lipopolysaccharide export system protein LptA